MIKLTADACCLNVLPLPDAKGENAHWRVICRLTDEWKAQQQAKRAAYENGRHNHQQENPHITRNEIIAAEELKMRLTK